MDNKINKISNPKRIVLGIALSVLSGLMLTISFAPYNVWPLVFIAFLPLIIAQYRVMPGKHSSLASATMIGTWLFLYFGPSFFQGSFMLFLPVAGFLLNWLTEKGLRKFHEDTNYRWFIINGAVTWVGFEIIRTFIPGIATWGFVNYTLWSQAWLIQPVSIFGIYGLSMLIMFINYGIGQFSLGQFDRFFQLDDVPSIPRDSTYRKLVWIGAAALFWVGLSLIIYISRPDNPETIRVAAVQPGITEVSFQNPDMNHNERFDIIVEQTSEAASRGAEIIVWSELFLPFDPKEEFTTQLKSLAAETDAYLILPYGVFEEEGLRNESIILAPNGEFSDLYAKAHPVLFAGEPYGLNVGTFPVFETPIGTLAMMICYDLNYTDIARKIAKKGAQIIAAPASDWSGIAEKQNIHLVFRAIETRTAIINAEKAFDSAIVDPYGHILEETISTHPEKALLVTDLPISSTNTLYQILGDWIGWLALAGMLFFTLFSKKLVKLVVQK